LLGQTHCCGKLILVLPVRCLNTLLSMVARAAFMLAETYDARVLQSWRAQGISGDPTKARELYERAEAGGIEDARDRIETLK
jgi:hypothetical protein